MIGKSASGVGGSRKGDPRTGQPKTQKTDANVDRAQILVHPDRRLSVRLIAKESYGNLFGGKYPNSDRTSRFSTMTVFLCMMP
jgi:hypothetical protein